MKLFYSRLNLLIDFDKESIQTIVIENPVAYRKMAMEIMEQFNLLGESFILSESFMQLDFKKSVEIINDIVLFDVDSNKKITSSIAKELSEIANNEMQQQFLELSSLLNEFVNGVIGISGLDLAYDDAGDVSAILKLHNIRPDVTDLSLAEKLLLYMELCDKFLKKKLFVVFNLHSYFTDEEIDSLLRDMKYRKYKVFIIERYDVKASVLEEKTIIDEDLCEI